MKKGVIFGLLLLAAGFILWRMIAGELSSPMARVAAGVKKENFTWFTCASCGKLFMAEGTTTKGYCPYCGFTMLLLPGEKKVFGTSVDESQFVTFFSPGCKKPFFAYQTKQVGKCPYCGESIDLTVPETIDLQESPPGLLVFAKAHAGNLLLIAVLTFGISIAGIYILLGNRVILSFEPIEAPSEERKIEFSKRKIKKKQLTLGPSTSDDITISHPSLKDFHCTLSFVRVGKNTHAYLRRSSNLPVWVNDKPQYNAQLKNHDKIRLGDIVFEVHANEKHVQIRD